MAKTYIEYRKLLQSLLPKGKFWTRDENSNFTQLLNGLGGEPSRIEQRAEDLIDEAIPSTVTELLEEWEDDFNLPDPGYTIKATTAGRREIIKAKYIAVGQQDAGYFEDIATALGKTVTITQFPKSLAGLAQAGVSVATPEDGLFYWMVDVWVTDPNDANIDQLMLDIMRRQPAHGMVLFRFYNVGFSNGFSNGFSAVPWWDGSWWPIGFDRGFSNGFANNSDYDGSRLTGGFSSGFSEAFDSYRGGGFDFDGFSNGFWKPT